MKETSYKKFGFEPIIEDNHVLYYIKDDYKIDDKYKMTTSGNIELYIQVLKADNVIFEALSEEEINGFLEKIND